MKKVLFITVIGIFCFDISASNAVNFNNISKPSSHRSLCRSGCCSHHGGVCGCGSNRRTICCDGNFSPSCGC